jgi:1A family penicillin-binding protein
MTVRVDTRVPPLALPHNWRERVHDLTEGALTWLSKPRPLQCLTVAVAMLMSAVGLGTTLVAWEWRAAGAAAREIATSTPPLATELFDKDGQQLWLLAQEKRVVRGLSDISPTIIAAVLTTEDRRFYEHDGVDPGRIMAAGFANLRAGRVVQGGSTITQQLVRTVLEERRQSLDRKFREALIAWRLERRMTKDAILQAYLNRIYFGGGCYGVEAAARGFFNTSAAEVTPDQAALLASVIHSPSTYRPGQPAKMKRLLGRRNYVLTEMADRGVITRDQLAVALAQPVTMRPLDTATSGPDGAFFEETVRQELVKRFGNTQVLSGGLIVHTTIDSRLQALAEEVIAKHLKDLDARRGNSKGKRARIEAGLIAMDARTGEVRAMVGGRAFKESQFDRVRLAHRPPGSAFKPIVYAAALEQGMSPGTVLANLETPVSSYQGGWLPADLHAESSMSIRQALTVSSNRAAAHVFAQVGAWNVTELARRLGITSPLPAVPSLAIGTGEVTLLELTGAYMPFANGGFASEPHFIRRVEDQDGRVIWDGTEASHRVITESTAFLMTTMLSDVINRGTGTAIRRAGVQGAVAGKTGTTDDFHDAWFIGYSPGLVTGVWFGTDQPGTIVAGGQAARVAAPAWGAFMAKALVNNPKSFPLSQEVQRVEICRHSGLIAHDGCKFEVNGDPSSGTYFEWYANSRVPRAQCDIHY